MYINRALLLLLGMGFVLYPTLEAWFFEDFFHWWGVYLLWLLIVLATWWNQRSRGADEL
ncbi:MAG: hypothetical protein AAGI11_17760 [Pseudomonadota bacterium]